MIRACLCFASRAANRSQVEQCGVTCWRSIAETACRPIPITRPKSLWVICRAPLRRALKRRAISALSSLTSAMCWDNVSFVIDMQLNNRINRLESGKWVRCQDVSVRKGMLYCTLAPDQTYDLAEAYKSDLHIRFGNATTERDLIAFVRSWGPLYFPNSQIPETGKVSLPLNYCRTYQRWQKALIGLLNAFRQADCERESLQKYIEAEYESARLSRTDSGDPASLMLLKHNFGIRGDVIDWAKGADLRSVRAATDFLVPLAPVHPLGFNLVCRRERKLRYVEANWTFRNLLEALHWMIFYDEFRQHPIICCDDCQKVFRADSAHIRKYCSPECAHRATARIWQREYNKRKRRTGGT